MLDIGRVCVKIAGRDAGKKCVIVDIIDKNTVIIDGETRRRKSGVSHLEPLATVLEIEKGADNAAVVAAMKNAGIDVSEKKTKEAPKEKATEKPKKARKVKPAKPAAKTAAKKK